MGQGEQQFIKGFNNGYLIAEHEPVLMAQMAKTLEPKNDYLSGFISGKEEYEIEQQKAQLNELGQIRNRSKDQGKELDKE